ncbi:MAG: hypothetical protein MSS97_07040 [Arcanobacterium sp.]|nr:hypothetical protein [Arcanobacterium sp.]
MFSSDQKAGYTPWKLEGIEPKNVGMDKSTVMTLLDLMDDEMIFEWSYRVRTDTRPCADKLYALVGEYLGSVYAD